MSDENFVNISFDLPKNQSNVIKVIGVGGGGSNAINHMFQQGIKGVDFVICNTDAQALQNSGVPNKIQLGVNLTEGLGAGANPEVGEKAAIESYEAIKNMLDTNTKMVFITAGMGGGTGTGAAPIIAKMAKEMEVLTVGIVTIPFQFEGKMRNEQAHKGIDKLREVVDSLIVINNNKLREVYGNLGFKAGFSKADEVLATAARGIAEVITHHYTQNIDLRDAKTVLSNSGTAIMGSASAKGENRAQEAIMKALDSPLLNDNKITGAKNVLLLIVSGSHEITIDEIGEISDYIQSEAGHGADIIMGVGEDASLEDAVSVTIIATGFNAEQQHEITNTEVKKVIHALEDEQPLERELPIKTPDFSVNVKLDKHHPSPAKRPDDEMVRHTLEVNALSDETFSEKKQTAEAFEDNTLIPTTQLIKDCPVVSEVIDAQKRTDDLSEFEIVDITENEVETQPIDDKSEQQFTLTFDLPINKKEEIMDLQVNEYEELSPIEKTTEPVKHYSLLDENEQEKERSLKMNTEGPNEKIDEELVFEKKISEPKDSDPAQDAELDPVNTPINELLRARSEFRKREMKEFNYRFRENVLNELEKQPAYKRRGVDIEPGKPSEESKASRTSVTLDKNEGVQLRSNNSFLHDNVD